MLLENLDRYKVSTTKAAVTSFAGLLLPLGMAKSLGVVEALNELAGLKERDRGYTPGEMGMTLMGVIQAGGVALEDVRLLKRDEGLGKLLGKAIPAANTLGEFLRRFWGAMVYRLGCLVLKTGVKVIKLVGLKKVTLDIDAFMIESQKDGVLMNYEGLWGYCPGVVSCAELKMPLAGIFRPGNASPMANLAGLLKRVMEALRAEMPDLKILVRSDSAGYQAQVALICKQFGADFSLTARKDEAVMETIRSIPEKDWGSYEHGAYPGRRTEMAETAHAFGEKDLPAYRLIVLRWPKEKQMDFLDKDPFEYHAVMVSREEGPAGLALQFHRNRQDKSENVNKELLGGFGLSKLPCGETLANAAYFQMALLSQIVVVALKYLALPEDWQPLTVETLRLRLIRLAGVVQRRARTLWLKLPQGYPYLKIFEEARWATLGAAVWVT